MCKLCNQNDGEMEGCQDCGRLICFDIKAEDDITAPAYVTASGDLFCRTCGLEYDRLDEQDEDLCDFYYEP